MSLKRVSRPLLSLLVLVVSFLLYEGCRWAQGPPPDRRPWPTGEMSRPADPTQFEILRPVPDRPRPEDARTNPPVATRAGVTLLAQPTSQGNALLSVEFDPKTLRGERVVIQEDGRRVVLHDNGQEGDEKARDGFFSAFVTVDP